MAYDTPTIKVDNPMVEDHYIYFQETGLRTPLQLCGVLSYFPNSKPTSEDMTDSGEVYLLTTTRWNPHEKAYSLNKEIMFD